jgi:CubicO group peptidase (beta-lactamase class C family)
MIRTWVALFLFLSAFDLNAQINESLPRSIPESEGVSSAGIQDFLEAAGKSKTEFHSFMFLRHGKVIAEGWWNPYTASLKHTLYSTSKSFTAAAIGFALGEHRLNLDDKVISFFPGILPDSVSANLASLSVKDVLMMSDGQTPDPTGILAMDTNWAKGFLALPIVHKPGTAFLYNSMGTYMLSAIVQKVTGQKVIDYLRPRLFDPLGITGMDWEVSPQGINTGGWGLRLKTEDMAKFGQLYLQKGIWNGNQILPRPWVEEATTKKIDQDPSASQARKDSSDWLQGYCYQMWRCRHDAFRADGAYGQFIIMMPEEDAVIAITAETPNMQEEINLIWNYLLPAIHKGKLPADKANETRLQQTLSSLALPPLTETTNASISALAGQTFTMESNDMHLQEISFMFKNGICEMTIKQGDLLYPLSFGEGNWQLGNTPMHGPYLLSRAKSNLSLIPIFKIAGSYNWIDNQTLQLALRYIESPHAEKITCHVDQKNLTLVLQNSFDYGGKKTVIKGVLK